MIGKKTVTKVPKVVTVQEEVTTITISDITLEDAKVLRSIMHYIGGQPLGPRGASDRFSKAISDALGISTWEKVHVPAQGQLYFLS